LGLFNKKKIKKENMKGEGSRASFKENH